MMVVKKIYLMTIVDVILTFFLNLKRRLIFDGYNDYQKRIYGFLAERLLNVYVKKNNLKIYQMGVIQPRRKS